jgi:WD40 repeat protein
MGRLDPFESLPAPNATPNGGRALMQTSSHDGSKERDTGLVTQEFETRRRLDPPAAGWVNPYATKPLKPVAAPEDTVKLPSGTAPTLRSPEYSKPPRSTKPRWIRVGGALFALVLGAAVAAFMYGSGATSGLAENPGVVAGAHGPAMAQEPLQRWIARATMSEFPESNCRGSKERGLLVAWHPSGDTVLLFRSLDCESTLWDGDTGTLVKTFRGAEFDSRCGPWSPDGRGLAFTCVTTVDLWDPEARRIRHRLEGERVAGARLDSSAWSPDGSMIATSGNGQLVSIHDARTGARLAITKEASVGGGSIDWSADGGLVAFGGFDGNVQIWNVAEGRPGPTLELSETYAHFVSWNPTASILAVADESAVRLWDVANQRVLAKLDVGLEARALPAWSPNGRLLAIAAKGEPVRLLDGRTGASRDTSVDHPGQVTALAWSPDARILATGGEDGTVRLWDAESGSLLAMLEGHEGAITSLGWNRSGATLASGSADGTGKLWSARPSA